MISSKNVQTFGGLEGFCAALRPQVFALSTRGNYKGNMQKILKIGAYIPIQII